MSENSMSVFDLEYISPEVKTVESGAVPNAFLMLVGDSRDAYEQLGISSSDANKLMEQGYTELIVTNVTENHAEAYTVNNTLSDTIYAFALGAAPIAINISCYALRTPEQDFVINFLKLYTEQYRGKALEHNKTALYFGYKDTVFRLYINHISISTQVDLETYFKVDIVGVASHYRIKPVTKNSIDKKLAEQREAAMAAEREAESRRLSNSRNTANKINYDRYSQEKTQEELRLANNRAMATNMAIKKAVPNGGTAVVDHGGEIEIVEIRFEKEEPVIVQAKPISRETAEKLGNKVPVVKIDKPAVAAQPVQLIKPVSKPTPESVRQKVEKTQNVVAPQANPAARTNVQPNPTTRAASMVGGYEVRQNVEWRQETLSHKHYTPSDKDRVTWTTKDIPNSSTLNPKDDVIRNRVILQVKLNEQVKSSIDFNAKTFDGSKPLKQLDTIYEQALRQRVEFQIYKKMVAEGYKFN